MADIMYIASNRQEEEQFKPLTNKLHGNNNWFIVNSIEGALELSEFILFDFIFAGNITNINLIKLLESHFSHLPMAFQAEKGNRVLRDYHFLNPVQMYDKPLSSIDMMSALLFSAKKVSNKSSGNLRLMA